jgi:hypothetical protein
VCPKTPVVVSWLGQALNGSAGCLIRLYFVPIKTCLLYWTHTVHRQNDFFLCYHFVLCLCNNIILSVRLLSTFYSKMTNTAPVCALHPTPKSAADYVSRKPKTCCGMSVTIPHSSQTTLVPLMHTQLLITSHHDKIPSSLRKPTISSIPAPLQGRLAS